MRRTTILAGSLAVAFSVSVGCAGGKSSGPLAAAGRAFGGLPEQSEPRIVERDDVVEPARIEAPSPTVAKSNAQPTTSTKTATKSATKSASAKKTSSDAAEDLDFETDRD